ncbi:hypothetical protein HU200_021986 [Digitaria exilis]|uniref:Cytochrome P450 n=1 Tax=Digitaria exilis TaxID=1010633 RepID=A0A835C1V4_9POAL|nr:hypothetical protein HU200_021986 [Digitaria exilis]
MELIWLVFLPIISLLILVSLHSRKSRADRKKRRRPPGPRGLPFIGSIHHLLTSQPQAALRDLAKKHGPVMYLRLGQVDTVVVSRRRRRRSTICNGDLDIAFAPYGDYWRALRKLCTLELLSARKVKQFAAIRGRETMFLVAEVQAAAAAAGEPVNLGALLVSCSKLFVDVATGVRYRLQKAHRQLDQVLDEIIVLVNLARRRKNNVQGDRSRDEGEDDLLSVLLRIRDEGEFEVPIKVANMKAIIVVSPVAEWVMSELIKNPGMMAKAQAEVRQAFNNKNTCDHESNLHHLHYLSMVIKETMRLYPPLPLLLPRLCRETCDIGGSEVAKGTRVIVNSWAIARSPEYWDDSEKFNPERFEKIMADTKVHSLSTYRSVVGEGCALARVLGWPPWNSFWHASSTISTGAC